MTNIRGRLSQWFGKAFVDLGLEAVLGNVIVSDRPDLAPYQCNGALSAARILKTSPREIANKIIQAVQHLEELDSVEIAGAGFLNIRPKDILYTQSLGMSLRDRRAGIPVKEKSDHVIIDFGGPNVAKPMHVGHLRSSINGDCLQRLFRFMGDKVTSDVHLGDWGLQMGQLLDYYRREAPDLVYFDTEYSGDYPKESPVTLQDLQYSYPLASGACKADPERMEKARKATYELQEGRSGYRALWKHFYSVSVEALQKDFGRLGVQFDLWKGESDVDAVIPDMIKALKDKKLAIYDDGALIVRLEPDSEEKKPVQKTGFKDRSDSVKDKPLEAHKKNRENPPLMLLKSDGSVLYETTDLATILERKETLHPDLILYVVDLRQQTHFEKVFKVAKLAGYTETVQLEFIGLGTMNGVDGRPFKTRSGGVLRLADLIDMTVRKALGRLEAAGLAQNMTKEERQTVAEKIGISALKFADLSNNRNTSYVFDLERFTAFEGKTGPYLLYAVVRIKSLLKKAEGRDEALQGRFSFKSFDFSEAFSFQQDQERELAQLLDQFQDALLQAYKKRSPHFISDYAYHLAQSFSAFYAACPILAREIPEKVRNARLAFSLLTLKQLEICLNLLGIEVPERM